MLKKCALLTAFSMFFSVCFVAASQESAAVQTEINAPRIAVFDAASQVLIQKGFTIVTTNERIGLLTTDYKSLKATFGGSLLLSLFGRGDPEVMISTNIAESNNRSILSILPKARIKKETRLKIEYEEFALSRKMIEGFRAMGEQIKAIAEQNAPSTAAAAPVAKKLEAAEKAEPVPQPAAAAPKTEVVEVPYVRIKVNVANIRNAASTQAGIIKQATLNSEFKVIGIENDWFEILVDKAISGYLNNSVCEQFKKTEKLAAPDIAPVQPQPVAAAAPPVPEEKKEGAIRPATVLESAEPAPAFSKGRSTEKSVLLGVGGGIALPFGDWSYIGFGLDLNALFRMINNLYVGGYLGAYYFPESECIRLQPMLQFQYQYPIGESIKILGGIGLGIAIDNYFSYGADIAFAADLFAGVRLRAFTLTPRVRLTIFGGEMDGSIGFSLGFVF